MNLGSWNQRLVEHFGALARDRKDIPLFALEHGLLPAEVVALSDLLRAHIQSSAPARDHQLAWTVYAAEVGYRYAGDEYWQTFEEKTPGWTLHGARSWIRDAFVVFQEKFAAASPSGPWAEQFSIIAWPITHAILPRDLQQQLARILYDLRHSFSAELFNEPQRLGDFIAARSWNTSARFRNLVQAPALVGQIAAALLLQDKAGFKSLLQPMTLKRISDDVDRERGGRDWLRSARRAAVERAEFHRFAISKPTTTLHRRDEARAEVERLGIEPRLLLRPIEGSRWEVSLEIPDLSHLLVRFPQMRDILTESRCTVAGAAGRPLARGRCLHGPQRIALRQWPRPDDVLLKFERADAQLEYLLRAECMLRPGVSWLFKVASDGLAYESRGMRVRAGTKYILVSTEALAGSPLVRRTELTCVGVHAALLDLPPALTSEWERVLEQLGVIQAKTIEVWPAGLAAFAWDGDGRGEWLSPETPTLAIRSDHAIDELTIAMSDGSSLALKPTDVQVGEPIFVELSSLTVGLHRLSVAARGGSGEVIGETEIVVRLREAHAWSPGAVVQGALEVEVDPATPSLEQIWEGKVAAVIRGPDGRNVKCRVQMFGRSQKAPLFGRQLPPLTLPFSSDEWTRHFDTHVKGDEDAARAYDNAQVCDVEFSVDEFGVFTLRCEREFTPLRWSVRRDSTAFVARLHNDTGNEDPTIERFSFERPTVGETLPLSAEYSAPRRGGLYSAMLGAFNAAIIVPPIVKGLAELQCDPQIDAGQRKAENISNLITLVHLWGTARLSGDPIASLRRGAVVRAITAQIIFLVGGRAWASAESRLHDERGLKDLKRSISDKGYELGLGSGLLLEYQALADAPLAKRAARVAALAKSFRLLQPSTNQSDMARDVSGIGPEHSTWFAEFALRITSDPVSVRAWAGEHIDAAIEKLLDVPTLARAARFLVLAVENVEKQRKSIVAPGELYAGWRWPA